MIPIHTGTAVESVTDEEFEKLRSTVLQLIELQQQNHIEVVAAVTAQVQPTLARLEIQSALAERAGATLH
ncbi:hypothetical protein [Halomonas salipaludis]|uniref:Uncharacterized protein n=1 Tax=Halomonas salipaludis TaxID=2032625 RepID=A0A2A2F2Q7_9GAMM|nr:hypothetical protein [Halomonas salipaludis]PAU78929.1 hypothetical protein CK498_00665 [Halomonas salipaludis]